MSYNGEKLNGATIIVTRENHFHYGKVGKVVSSEYNEHTREAWAKIKFNDETNGKLHTFLTTEFCILRSGSAAGIGDRVKIIYPCMYQHQVGSVLSYVDEYETGMPCVNVDLSGHQVLFGINDVEPTDLPLTTDEFAIPDHPQTRPDHCWGVVEYAVALDKHINRVTDVARRAVKRVKELEKQVKELTRYNVL